MIHDSSPRPQSTVEQLPTSAPEARGIPSSAIQTFVDAVDRRIDALHSLVLVRHGHVVARGWWQPYRSDSPHLMFSVSKSFTSTAVGLAVAEGRLSVDDPVLPFFPDATPREVGPHLAALRVRHLLTMSTGHSEETVTRLVPELDDDWVKAILAQPIDRPPGSHFVYNNAASYLLSAIVQRVTGVTLLEYLRSRLFEPLGIVDPTWETCPRGISAGGWGLSLRTDELARFGELYLREGVWRGKQVVPREWVREATAPQVDNSGGDRQSDWQQGYGYQFWRCRHGAYRGDGAFGQFCLVLPEQDAVLAMTGGLTDMQAVLDLVWEHLVPAMGPVPLAPNGEAWGRLERRLAGLRLAPMPGQASSPIAVRVSGRTYRVVADQPPVSWPIYQDHSVETIALHLDAEGCRFVIHDDRGEHEIVGGYGEWRVGSTTLVPTGRTPVAASGAWSDDETYVLRVCAYETPFIRTFTCRFEGEELTVTSTDNVGFGPTEFPPIRARLSGR